MPQTVLVTGGAGFIGSHLVRRLLAEGARVRVIDNLSTGKRTNLDTANGDLTLHETSFTDLEAIRPMFAGVDRVYHIGALPSVPRSVANPQESHRHNVVGTLNVLVAARDAGVRRVVYAASSSAYGDVLADYKRESMTPKPLSPYGAAKLAGEYYARAFTHSYGLETVCTRFFNVFGPQQDPNSHYAAVIPKFITLMQRGERPTIFGDGTQSRDFTYIDNVVYGLRLAATAPDANAHTINLAMGGQVTLLELVAQLNTLLGTDIKPILGSPRVGDIQHSRADVSLAGQLMDYTPLVTFEDGLARTVAWYQQEYAKSP